MSPRQMRWAECHHDGGSQKGSEPERCEDHVACADRFAGRSGAALKDDAALFDRLLRAFKRSAEAVEQREKWEALLYGGELVWVRPEAPWGTMLLQFRDQRV